MEAIPKSYKQDAKLNTTKTCNVEFKIKCKSILKAESKDFYEILIKNVFVRSTAEKHYADVSEEDWKKFYLIPWQSLPELSQQNESKTNRQNRLQRMYFLQTTH